MVALVTAVLGVVALSEGDGTSAATVRVMFVKVVANKGSGSGSEGAADERRREIIKAFQDAGAECEIQFVAGGQLEQAIADAASSGPDAVVVAGGDGSLGAAASALLDSDVKLGLLPSGTFNHLAKDLGIPLAIAEAAAAIVAGDTRKIDVGEVNGRFFVNNSSVGVYPMMVALRDRIGDQRGWGKVRSVPVACWAVMRRFPARRMTITAAGYSKTLRTPLVFVGNNRYDIGPGGIGQRESIAGGEIWVYVSNAASRLRLVWMALKTVVRGSHASADLEEHGASAITIAAGSHRLRVAIDGEVVTLRSPLNYRVRPGALTVLVPKEAEVPTGASPADASGADAEPRNPT